MRLKRALVAVAGPAQVLYCTTAVADYYSQSGEPHDEVVQLVEDAWDNLIAVFGLSPSFRVEVRVYPDQESFWRALFGERPNNGRTTGFADMDNHRIHVTELFRGRETGDMEMVRQAYNLSGWRERFVMEECLGGDGRAYLGFTSNEAFHARFTRSIREYPPVVVVFP